MADKSDYRPRIVFDVSEDTQSRLRNKLSWGDTKAVYNVITKQLIELLESHDPELVKAGILSEKVKLAQIIDFNKTSD